MLKEVTCPVTAAYPRLLGCFSHALGKNFVNLCRRRGRGEYAIVKLPDRPVDRMHMVIDEAGHDHAPLEVNDSGHRTDELTHRRIRANRKIPAADDGETLDPGLRRILRVDGSV